MFVKYIDLINQILSYTPLVVGGILLAFTFIQSLRGKLTQQGLRKCVWFAVAFFGSLVVVEIVAQYYAYKNDPFGQLFVPPHQSINWFLFYSWTHFIAPYVLSLASGLFMFFVALTTNTSFKRELFVENDKYILLLAALILSWPNCIVYLPIAALLVVLQTLFMSVIKKSFGERVILSNALLFGVIVTLLSSSTIAQYIEIWKLTV